MTSAEREQIRAVLARTDSADRRQIYQAWCELGGWRRELVPFVAAAYSVTRQGRGRASQLHAVVPFARFDDAAVELGLRALGDPHRDVRLQACGLLAQSRRADVVPALTRAARGVAGATATRAARALRDGKPFGPDDDPFYFAHGDEPYRAPRGHFADELFDEVGGWLGERGYLPSYLFQHTLECRSRSKVLRVEWDSYDVEARLLLHPTSARGQARARAAPRDLAGLAAVVRRAVAARGR